MKDIKIIEVKSELGAGTRGASLGIDAIKVASLNKASRFFAHYSSEEVNHKNELLFAENKTPFATNIEGIVEIETNVSEKVSQVLTQNHFPLVLAGDHSSAYGSITGIKKQFADKRLGVIWIDAHADLHSPYTSPSGNVHGMPLAMALATDNKESQINKPNENTTKFWEKIKNIGLEGAKINPQDIVFMAVRDTEEPEENIMKQYNIPNLSVEEIRQEGSQWAVSTALHILKDCDLIYISFDVDSLDASISQGTGTPVANGLTIEEVKTLNRLLIQNEKVCCWEMVEVNPTLDKAGNKMAEIAFEVLEEVAESYESTRKSK